MLDQTATIDAFLTATAARQPTPGGGSVAALVGALSAALGEMVLNYSVNKKELAPQQAELKTVLAELTRARHLLLQLMKEDQQAYAELTAARRENRPADAVVALAACLAAPQAVAATSLAVLELCDRVAGKVNPHLVSDLAICADLAMATVRCSMHNIRVNLADVTDAVRRAAVESNSARMLAHALATIQRFSRRSL